MTYRMLIDGQLVEGAATLAVIDPATGAPFATVARADEAQLETGVAAAKRAFPGWAALPHAERSRALLALADAVEARQEDFATLLTREQGKPLPQAQGEVIGTIMTFRWFAEQELPIEVLRDTPT